MHNNGHIVSVSFSWTIIERRKWIFFPFGTCEVSFIGLFGVHGIIFVRIMSEKFCLKWNDFHSNILKSFRELRNEEDFYDVTIVSDDQKQLSAHKVVLSASSEYFKNILKQNKHPNPLNLSWRNKFQWANLHSRLCLPWRGKYSSR